MPKSLNQLRKLRKLLTGLKRGYLRRVWGMDIDPSVEMSLSAKFDLTHPAGIHVGRNTYVAFEARILSHDMTRAVKLDTRIGANCFIGGRSMILPGVTIGDSCIVGAGAVVTRDVPPGSIVAGNPAKVLRGGVTLLPYGRMQSAFDPSIDAAPAEPAVPHDPASGA